MADDGGKPGFLTRLGRAASASARYVISGVDSSSNWFGPMQPLQPMAPADVKGRAFDYRTGYNLQYRPRGTELVGFAKLRALAEGSNIVQTVMNRQKDLIEAFDWSIKPREDQPGRRPAESKFKAAITDVSDFLRYPDQVNDWGQWLRILLEEVFVIDALAIYRRPTRDGTKLWALEIIDGSTLTPLLGYDGRMPQPPSPAYQQILKGVPASDFTAEELFYYRKNPRSNRVYGCSPCQQIIDTVEADIERQRSQLAYFREGNYPDKMLTAPADWCYTEDTEVLTQRGWQRFADVDIATDMFATRGGGGQFEWQKATGKNVFAYDGEVVSLKSRTIDCAVNPPHRVLLCRRQRDGTSFEYIKTAADVLAHHSDRELIPVSSKWTGTEVGSRTFDQRTRRGGGRSLTMTGDQFCAFMGAWLAEGSRGARTAGIAQQPNGKAFREYERLVVDLLGRSNYDGRAFQISNAPLTRYLEQYGTARDKFVPPEVMDATPRQIDIFLRYFALGDGNLRGDILYTSSKRLADQLQELAQKAGKSAIVSVDDRIGRRAFIGGRAISTTSLAYRVHIARKTARKFHATSSHYSGMLGCVSVPNSILYVRRNGKACWSGNTTEQIEKFQSFWDDQFAGRIGERRHGQWVPTGTKVQDLKQPPLKDEFDEWLARKVCFAFSTSPQPFIKQVSRGNQENQQEVAEEGGIATYMQFLKRIMDRIVADDFGQPQLEFVWSEDREFDPTEAATIDDLRLHNGSATLNEVRDRNGDDPYPAEIGDVPLIILATGAISVADALAPPEPPPGDGEATGQGEPPPVAGAAGGATPPKPNAPAKPREGAQPPAKPSEGTQASQLKKDACAALAAAAEAGLVDPLDPAVAAALAEHAAFVKADVEAALDRLAKKASLAVPLETPKMRGQEPRMRAAIGKHLKALGADVRHQAHRKLLAMGKADGDAPTKEDADEIADSLDLSALSAIAEAVEDQLIAVAQDGGGGAIAMLGAADRSALTGQVAVATMNWARARAAELVGKRWTADGQLIDNPSAVWAISQSTRDMLRETIADALAANLDVPGIADAIQNAYAFSADRSALIAHTEIRRANVQGALVGARTARDQDGLAIKKSWLTGQNPCEEICIPNEAAGEIDLDDDFESGDDAPPGHPGCYCTLALIPQAQKSAPRLRSFAEGA